MIKQKRAKNKQTKTCMERASNLLYVHVTSSKNPTEYASLSVSVYYIHLN